MEQKDYFKFKIIKGLNLVLIYPVCISGNFAGMMQLMNDEITKDPDYREGLNAIVQYQDSRLPYDEFYYNDLDRKVLLTARVNILVDVFSPDEKQLAYFARIFKVFAVNNKDFTKKTYYVYSLEEAIKYLQLEDHADMIEKFYSEKPVSAYNLIRNSV